MRTSIHTLFAVLFVPLAGCVYHPSCEYPAADTSQVVFTLDQPVPLTQASIGTQESAFGDAVADGYLQAFSGTNGGPTIALEVAAAIHSDSLPSPGGKECPSLNANGELSGTVTVEALHDALPREEPLVVEQVTLRTLFNILEHGVAAPASDPSSEAIDGTTGNFVQVSGLEYWIDCSQPSETTTTLGGATVRTAEGQRVTALLTGSRRYARADEDSDTAGFSVAMPQSLAQGCNAFFDWHAPPAQNCLNASALSQGESEFYDLEALYAQFGAATYSASPNMTFDSVSKYLSLLPSASDGGGTVDLPVAGRVNLTNCGQTD